MRLVASPHTLTCPAKSLPFHSMNLSSSTDVCHLILVWKKMLGLVSRFFSCTRALLSQQSVPAAYLLSAICLEGGVGLVMALSHLVLHVGNLGLQCEGCPVI